MVAVVDRTVLMTTGVVVVVRVLIAVLVAGFVTVLVVLGRGVENDVVG